MTNAIAYFPGNTAALDAYRKSPAFQVIPDRKIGGYHVIHMPIAPTHGPACGLISNNAAS